MYVNGKKVDMDYEKPQFSAPEDENTGPSLEDLKKMSKVVNDLFERLKILFPAFRQSWPTEHEFATAKQVWTEAFCLSKMSSTANIELGLKRFMMMSTPFVPTPGEFIGMCRPRPEDVGAPPVDEAYLEVIRNSYPYEKNKVWTHPCIYHAWTECDTYHLANTQSEKSKADFAQTYLKAVQDKFDGKPMKTIPEAAIGHSASPEAALEEAIRSERRIRNLYRNILKRPRPKQPEGELCEVNAKVREIVDKEAAAEADKALFESGKHLEEIAL